jgi:hypothetical protein
MSLFTDTTNSRSTSIPYRARYKASFSGSQTDLCDRLINLLAPLHAASLDQSDHNEPIRHNPLNDRYELAATLAGDQEFSLLAYWPDTAQTEVDITFDLDSPIPIEINIDHIFLHPAQQYFPNLRQIYNWLSKPKNIVHPMASNGQALANQQVLANQQWLKTYQKQYRGRWVALRDGHLLADASSVAELLQQIKSTDNTMLTVVY